MASKSSPRVLIVNDDGIDAPGIKLLEEMVARITDDIWVVAPDEERSGAGHSISISHPIRVKQRDERHFAIKGSPTDCALLGIYEFMGDRRPDILLSGINAGPNLAEDITYSGTCSAAMEGALLGIYEFMGDRRPDILLSGINAGPNLAEDITYSGTCSAAMEGALLGIPSVALSQYLRYQQPVHWDTSRHFLPDIIEQLIRHPVRPGSFVNVNVPDRPVEDVTGIRITTQGRRAPGSYLPKKRIDERFVPYYWIKIAHLESQIEEGSDLAAMRDGAVSITPIQIDMTDHTLARELEKQLIGLKAKVSAAA